MKHLRFLWFILVAGALSFGCGKQTADKPTSKVAATAPGVSSPVVRIHWLGKKRLAAETNAAGFMAIWNEPESAALEAQTLDKLSRAPWRLLRGETGTNAASALLRPLLDDAVNEEYWFEIRQATNQPAELAFAIRLDNDRAALWQTNLAAVLESLTAIHPQPVPGRNGWSLKKHHAPDVLELIRIGDWTIFGAGWQSNRLLQDFIARIEHGQTPYPGTGLHFWLEAGADLAEVGRWLKLDSRCPVELPRIFVRLTGDGETVYSRGDLIFRKPPPLNLEPWNVPTNLIRGALGSFTAARGIGPLLATNRLWTNLDAGPPPNQFYGWASSINPFQSFVAVPVSDASNRMAQLSDQLIRRVNPWLTTNRAGILERSPDTNGVVWAAVPFIAPYARADGDFILAGFFPNDSPALNLPPDILRAMSPPDLVYYDWELTGPRIESWFRVGQLFRVVMRQSQLPAEGAAMPWLVTNVQRFGSCVTTITRNDPARFSFVRRSSVGFTAIELHLLADWLESPDFPVGLNTFRGQTDFPKSTKPPVKD